MHRPDVARLFEQQMVEIERTELDSCRRALLQELQRLRERVPNVIGELRGLAGRYRGLGDSETAEALNAIAAVIEERATGLVELS